MSKNIPHLLKRLNAKKESLFRRIQTLYDMIKNLNDEKIQYQFLIGFRGIDKLEFEKVIDEINDLELELNDEFLPNYESLNSYISLYGALLIAHDKINVVNTKDSADTKLRSSLCNPQPDNLLSPFKAHNNLPPLEIKKFTGNVTDWPRYRDLFTSLIIKNVHLTGVEKMHYLITTLSDQPAIIVKDFPLSDSNFDLAWTALTDRYESDRVLASSYFEELTKPITIPTKPTQSSLQNFISRVSSNVSGLQKMQIQDLTDFLFFSIAVRQLDPVTRKSFENQHGTESIPSFDSLIKYVKSQCRLLEITSSLETTPLIKTDTYRKSKYNKPSFSGLKRDQVLATQVHQSKKASPASSCLKTVSNHSSFSHSNPCPKCTDSHKLYHCPSFLTLNVFDRRVFVKQNNLCFNCMGSHSVKTCKSIHSCTHCSGRHHTLLHYSTNNKTVANTEVQETSQLAFSPPRTTSQPSTSDVSPPVCTTCPLISDLNKTSVVLLGTACAQIQNHKGHFISFRLLLDCASTATFITKSLVDKLGLSVQDGTQPFLGLSNHPVGSSSGVAECIIKPRLSNHPKITTRALIVDNIINSTPQSDIPVSALSFIQGLQLADPYFYRSQPIDMLIGCDFLPKILLPNAVPPHHSTLGVLPTIFGHVIIGSLFFDLNKIQHTLSSLVTYPCCPDASNNDKNLHQAVEKFWELENIIVPPATDPSEDFCEQHFVKTYRRTPEGRYIVQLPFNCDPNNLIFPEAKDVALQRFYSLENRFRKNPNLKNDSVSFMNQYKTLGHMVKANRPGKYFIPYFCVFNSNSLTTPARIVFDGSAKKNHVALNEVLLPGPKLQNNVPDILLNFRIHKFVFCCDISKMYRQILVDDDHCAFMHILFREHPDEPLEEYELRTVTYGLSPSSFLAHRVLRQLTRDEGDKYPLACPVIFDSSIVDDYLVGCDSVDELLEVKHQLTQLLGQGGFTLNKWLSNSPKFINELQCSDPNNSLVFRNLDDNSIKVLGIGWDPNSDEFFFSLDPPPIQSSYTKRQVLSTIARIYDPTGMTTPMIFLFKCILKEIWLSGSGWDESIPPTIASQWHQCLAELPNLSQLRIPRCVFPSSAISYRVLGFCDGSVKGSAAAIYILVNFADQDVRMFLLKAKSRVAPSKTQTIPRLELIAAVLLSSLVSSLKQFFQKISISNEDIILCSDSTIVLSWIKKPPHLLKLFVSNRVTAILENCSPSQWYHVPTEHNISDVASRGLTPQGLLSFPAWFNGPSWALEHPDKWPIKPLSSLISCDINLPEIKVEKEVVLITTNDCSVPPWLTKYSKFTQLQRVIGYVLRFFYNLRHPLTRRSGPLSVLELNMALNACIRCDQFFNFKKELLCIANNTPCIPKIQSLSPFIDDHGLIRVGGRLALSSLPYSVKHPILLSNTSSLTTLLVSYYHHISLHAGPRTLEAILLRKYWILNARQLVRKIIYKCVRCARFRGQTLSPPMGNLPSPRVVPGRPFLTSGVDLAGPFILKESMRKNARTYKGYFALFVCFAIKAVHIEVLTTLSSDGFIAALQRFICRRGLPSHIYCDQATNFRGASRQLSEIVNFLTSSADNQIIKDHLSSQGITFHFSVPRAPHMSGLSESNIKNVKYHLSRCIGKQILTLEEFSTITVRIEAILNSRPLYSISHSVNDLKALTPAHFLTGGPLNTPAETDFTDTPMNRLSRWELVSQINRSLWHRWETEYLSTLQIRAKWFLPATNIAVDQVVWLKEDGSPPLSYPLGRILEVHPGKDGIVRAATVRTQSGTYRRPVRKLAPLP